jgi:competence protein ComEC
LTTVRYGERWQFDGPAVRRVPEAGQAPVVWMSLRGDEAIRLGGGYGFWLRERCLEGRRSCGRLLARGLEDFPDQAGLLRAFMLGNREALPERAHRAFTTTGTLHIAAISGAHVVILAGLLLIPLKALGFSQTRWIYVMAPLLLLYALGTGLAASAVRACIMACVYWSAFAFRRRPDGPSSLALSALLILAVAPGQLWEAGFLLSFGVVAGLMVLVAPLSEPLLERLRPELPGRPTRRMQIRSAVARPVISLAVVSLAAWLVSLPMTAQYFNLFSPVGLVANLLVVPLASLILLTGCLTLTLGWVLPLGADIFNHANRVLVDLLLFLVDWFHRWPGGHLFVQAPPWWFAPCWYACLVALVRGRRRLRWAAGGLAVLALLVGSFCSLRENRVTLAATPLGRGMAVLVEGPRADGILVDPGPGRVSRDLVRWLHTRGVDRLQAVVLTRATVDTAGALPALIEQIPVRELWLPASPVRSPTFTALVEQARQAGLEIKRLGRGDAGLWPGGVTWQVLHPDRDHVYGNALQGSLVLRVSRGPASALIAGAARPEWQAELLAQPMDVAASGLLVTSWASGSSWSETWLAQVRPGWRVRPPGDEESDQAAGIFSSLDYVLMEDQTAQWWLSDDPNDPLSSGPATHLWR